MISKITPLADRSAEALRAASPHAPYLDRLIRKQPETFERISTELLDGVWNDVVEAAQYAGRVSGTEDVSRNLRIAKQRAHLVLAAGDLSGSWSLNEVTSRISAFADVVANSALLSATDLLKLSPDGLFLVALGKMGAMELNYSSDIDLIAFFDPDNFDGGERTKSDSARRIVQQMVSILSEQTSDGYVFRTDLRLRPDPSSTPIAVSTKMASLYYESLGQNWERMAWIKARSCAGDKSAGNQFIEKLSPFVWRRNLDYWAINDIHAIKAMINSNSTNGDLVDPGADLKLGVGGIREIEFFAQTQQLIMGGRNTKLRVRDTVSALNALQAAGHISSEIANELGEAYQFLRNVEHRIQMRQDEQTHALPEDSSRRADIAALCGIPDLDEFDSVIREVRERVHDIYLDLFGTEDRNLKSAQSGNLVFTGVDPDPGTIKTLHSLGFSDPSYIIDTVAQWHRGHIAATRSSRGRELLTALLPSLLSDMGETGDADGAFKRFQTFIERIPTGVQTFSMLLAEDELRRDIVGTLALAPRLAITLGRQPQLVEALLTPELQEPLSLDAEAAFDDAMLEARRHVREAAFRIGHGLLHGHVEAADVGAQYSALADQTITAMAIAAATEVSRKMGPPPGDWCVVALGKLGGQALTASSDLDLMVIYRLLDESASPIWFSRFTQRLITALSADTAEGNLYDVDMRLRPSGRSGPVAVKLSSFKRYHEEEAWTWEHMALTRLRPICDQGGLSENVTRLTEQLLAVAPRREELTADILDMRLRLAREKPSRGLWDLKMGEGGLVDLEFIVQRELLMLDNAHPLMPRLSDALSLIAQEGRLPSTDINELERAESILTSLQQIQRLALTDNVEPEIISASLKNRLAQSVGAADFNSLEHRLRQVKSSVQRIRRERIGAVVDEELIEL